MDDVLMGLETEYAFTPGDQDGNSLERMLYSNLLVTSASDRYPSLHGRDEREGVFR